MNRKGKLESNSCWMPEGKLGCRFKYSRRKDGNGGGYTDHAKGVRAIKYSCKQGLFDPTVAETMAATHALHYCMTFGVDNISMEGDATNVVAALNSRGQNWSRTGHLIEDARVLLERFTTWDIHYVGRSANFAAHNIAKLAANMGINKEWSGEIPNCISDVIRREQSVILID